MKKRMMSIAMCLCMALGVVVPASATDVSSSQQDSLDITVESVNKEFNYEDSELFGDASIKDAIIINGEINYLYPTFDDIDSSIERLENAIPEYYRMVESNVDLASAYKYSYDDLMNEEVFVDVDQVLPSELDNELDSQSLTSTNAIRSEMSDLKETLLSQEVSYESFLDIYEGKALNERIIEYVENTPNPDPEELAFMLPYTAPFSIEYFENATPYSAATQTLNVSKATDYAIKHATSRNTSQYASYSSGDCTNFASQILFAGGVKMDDYYPTESKGWWHRKVQDLGTVNPTWQHHSSNTWRLANEFAKYMGTNGNTYTSFYTFSTKVKPGDFIAYDKNKNGQWNHIAYVTAVGSLGTYEYKDGNTVKTKYYKNFCVAQHSGDYYAWVNSALNSWEMLDGTANFAIVRRGSRA